MAASSKHDGYRLIVQRDGRRAAPVDHLNGPTGHEFPLITEAALRNRNSSLRGRGRACSASTVGRDFNGLPLRRHDAEVQFYAFDILVSDGEDLRRLPLSMRKANLSRLLARRVEGIFLSDFEQGAIGPDRSATPVCSGSKIDSTGLTGPVDRRIGSRSRTASMWRFPG